MKVCDVMTTRVVTVEMDDRLTVVKEILDKAPFRHLLVVENKQLQGVITIPSPLSCGFILMNSAKHGKLVH